MAAESRSVLIIDDAEVLQPSALEYLCEMASMAMPARPQFVFVGRPEFWEATNRTAPAQFKASDYRTLGTRPTECGHDMRLHRAIGRLAGTVDAGRIRCRRTRRIDGEERWIVRPDRRAPDTRQGHTGSATRASADLGRH